MTTSSTPEPAAGPSAQDPAGNAPRPARLESQQTQSRPGAPEAWTTERAQPGRRAARPLDEDADAPMPEVVPRVLRARPQAGARRRELREREAATGMESMQPAEAGMAQPFDAHRQILTAQTAAVVDSITRGVAEALALAFRPIIASTVDSLLPMILTLGSVPDPAPVQDAGALVTADAADGEAS